MGQSVALEWLALVERELLLFSAVFFLVGALDELAVDLVWLRMRLAGRARSGSIDRASVCARPLAGPAAVFIPAWHEDKVIDLTVAHALAVWPQPELRLFVGCYRNDKATADAVTRGAAGDARLRLVSVARDGPTTKADCLNALYAALEGEERRTGRPFRLVVLHDAEDMVDPAALPLLDQTVDEADFVQLPVLPEAQPASRWIGSHYCEEFAEAHSRVMVVREALSAGLPAAGVGCAFHRTMLGRIAREVGGAGPFSIESLTEDYELGLRVKVLGGRSRFLRARGEDGQLVATRAYFPSSAREAIRQKGRWMHGIALQGWDRLGWHGGAGEVWMRLRDRRGPFSALVLAVSYLVIVAGVALAVAGLLGVGPGLRVDPWLEGLLYANFAALVWRAGLRAAFTAREYGWREGLWAIARIPVGNAIAVFAARRALVAYARTLCGETPRWDKTAHDAHPAAALVPQRNA